MGGEDGAPFYDPVRAAEFPKHVLRYRNQRWAARVGLEALSDEQWLDHFGRFEPLPDNISAPLALRYHGHQFRNYNPQIGDGRGFLFAQLVDDQDRLLDLGTKGSGQTPYSRTADGRLTLKGGVREILATEMLEALGVYTSKTFSLIETGEDLERHDEPSPTRSAVMVRLSHAHVRFGAFQRLSYEKNADAIAALVDYAVAHFYPQLAPLKGAERVLAFFSAVVARTARLTA
ncbi:MAG: protein adenylyltransferase SelO family protein, partial [Pseudomonadota bacterium]